MDLNWQLSLSQTRGLGLPLIGHDNSIDASGIGNGKNSFSDKKITGCG
jgi:hypothetical protein